MQKPALIFDFGNVVAFFDYSKAFNRLNSESGLSSEDFRQRIEDRGFARVLREFECGQITPEVFAEEVMVMAGIRSPYHEFVHAWQDIFSLNEPIARLIDTLKTAGYQVLLGSNTNILHADHYRRQFASTLDQLDHLVLSHEVGHMKPDARFYAACVSAAGVPASSCVFIDDLADNIAGARNAGLVGIHYVDTPGLIADLRGLGVAIAAIA
jgi:putative hydrolase of the HAD superfamily